MLVSYYLPGNRSAPPPSPLVHGTTGHTEEEQSPFDPLPYGWWLGGGAMKMTKISVKWTPVWPVAGRRSNETVTKSLMNNDLLCWSLSRKRRFFHYKIYIKINGKNHLNPWRRGKITICICFLVVRSHIWFVILQWMCITANYIVSFHFLSASKSLQIFVIIS